VLGIYVQRLNLYPEVGYLQITKIVLNLGHMLSTAGPQDLHLVL
jgi:hypothetical protein